MNLKIIEILKKFCEKENNKLDSNCKYKYDVFQFSDINIEVLEMAYFISKFYNENYCGNVDFMHIPNFEQTVENLIKYPVVIAREKNNSEILGISILKYFDSNESLDPYFPIEGARYFSVTGILTGMKNKEKGYYGIGKKIYQIMLESVLEYKEYDNNIRLMCVIDCRNNNSIDALKVATDNLNDKRINSSIVGYYQVQSLENGLLVEAPTFVIEMLIDQNISKTSENIVLKYDNDSKIKEESYLKMKELIDNKLLNFSNLNAVINLDPECGWVTYYPFLDYNYSLENVLIDANGTELGNDRVPISKRQFEINITKYLCYVIKDYLINSSLEAGKILKKKIV